MYKYNPVWATINGRQVALQQWHWAVIPALAYALSGGRGE